MFDSVPIWTHVHIGSIISKATRGRQSIQKPSCLELNSLSNDILFREFCLYATVKKLAKLEKQYRKCAFADIGLYN